MTRGSKTEHLFQRYYFGRSEFVDGTTIFHQLCRSHLTEARALLEIGAGPANPTTRFLSSLAPVTGLDVSAEGLGNPDLAFAAAFDGRSFPFKDGSFDGCVSNFVLEHVADPRAHFSEIARVLRPGGRYVFRTPNLYHYVAAASRTLPHRAHVTLAKGLRAQTDEDHDPWVTFYRANSRRVIHRIVEESGLAVVALSTIEKEPSYGRASPLLFYPMLAYERIVNSSDRLAAFRSAIIGVCAKMDDR